MTEARLTPTNDPLNEMSVEEKAALTLGSDFWRTGQVPRLGVAPLLLSDGPHGIRHKSPDDDPAGVEANRVATCFPTAGALGASFDEELVERVGAAIGREARAAGISVVLGPGVNIKRSPRCGRNFEYFSEDPLVSGVLGEAWVSGLQSQGVGACVKHFAAYNQETDRLRVDVLADERTLREIYLPAFERIVRNAAPWGVMCSYNRLNGRYVSQDPWLLTSVLRDEWGFDGVVISDWGAVHDRVPALRAGLDLAMPPDFGHHDRDIADAVMAGELDPRMLDTAARRMIALADRARAGALAHPAPVVDVDSHHALAREAARAGIVLLKNERLALPLTLPERSRLAVLGRLALDPRIQGGGSSQVTPTLVDSPLEELRKLLPHVDVQYAPGYPEGTEPGQPLVAEAAELAASSDAVLVFAGLAPEVDSEGVDRQHEDLPQDQVEFLGEICRANPNIVVVLMGGSIVSLGPWHDDAAAVLHAWLGGQAIGGAIAEILTGVDSPGGRLAESWPLRHEDLPAAINFPGADGRVHYGERIYVGYRGLDRLDRAVAYPFGHGLSYTDFEYADLVVAESGAVSTGDLCVSVTCRVTNVGQRAAAEVVQLYVAAEDSSADTPPRELRAFRKVRLESGASTIVRMDLNERAFAHWGQRLDDWLVEPGSFVISMASSSRDIRLQHRLLLDAPARPAPLTAGSTLHEWLADPDGEAAVRAMVGLDADGNPAGVLRDPHLVRVLSEFPMRTLTAFPGLGVERAGLEVAVARVNRAALPTEASGVVDLPASEGGA